LLIESRRGAGEEAMRIAKEELAEDVAASLRIAVVSEEESSLREVEDSKDAIHTCTYLGADGIGI